MTMLCQDRAEKRLWAKNRGLWTDRSEKQVPCTIDRKNCKNHAAYENRPWWSERLRGFGLVLSWGRCGLVDQTNRLVYHLYQLL